MTARGAPSVGLGQKTDTSKAEYTSATFDVGVGTKLDPIPQRPRQLAQAVLGLARARENEMRMALHELDGFHHHVVSLLRMEARHTAHDEGVLRDAELFPHSSTPGPVVPNLVGAHGVVQNDDLLGRNAASDHRVPRAVRDRQHEIGAAGRQAIEAVRQAATKLERDRAPLGPDVGRTSSSEKQRQQLLLLEMDEKDVVRLLAPKRRSQPPRELRESGEHLQSRRPGQLRPEIEHANGDGRLALELREIGQHDRFVTASLERIEQLERGELGAAAGAGREHRDDLHRASSRLPASSAASVSIEYSCSASSRPRRPMSAPPPFSIAANESASASGPSAST